MDERSAIPDRAHLLTEQRNPRTRAIDCASVEECVQLLNDEDARVAAAVGGLGTAVSAGFVREMVPIIGTARRPVRPLPRRFPPAA